MPPFDFSDFFKKLPIEEKEIETESVRAERGIYNPHAAAATVNEADRYRGSQKEAAEDFYHHEEETQYQGSESQYRGSEGTFSSPEPHAVVVEAPAKFYQSDYQAGYDGGYEQEEEVQGHQYEALPVPQRQQQPKSTGLLFQDEVGDFDLPGPFSNTFESPRINNGPLKQQNTRPKKQAPTFYASPAVPFGNHQSRFENSESSFGNQENSFGRQQNYPEDSFNNPESRFVHPEGSFEHQPETRFSNPGYSNTESSYSSNQESNFGNNPETRFASSENGFGSFGKHESSIYQNNHDNNNDVVEKRQLPNVQAAQPNFGQGGFAVPSQFQTLNGAVDEPAGLTASFQLPSNIPSGGPQAVAEPAGLANQGRFAVPSNLQGNLGRDFNDFTAPFGGNGDFIGFLDAASGDAFGGQAFGSRSSARTVSEDEEYPAQERDAFTSYEDDSYGPTGENAPYGDTLYRDYFEPGDDVHARYKKYTTKAEINEERQRTKLKKETQERELYLEQDFRYPQNQQQEYRPEYETPVDYRVNEAQPFGGSAQRLPFGYRQQTPSAPSTSQSEDDLFDISPENIANGGVTFGGITSTTIPSEHYSSEQPEKSTVYYTESGPSSESDDIYNAGYRHGSEEGRRQPPPRSEVDTNKLVTLTSFGGYSDEDYGRRDEEQQRESGFGFDESSTPFSSTPLHSAEGEHSTFETGFYGEQHEEDNLSRIDVEKGPSFTFHEQAHKYEAPKPRNDDEFRFAGFPGFPEAARTFKVDTEANERLEYGELTPTIQTKLDTTLPSSSTFSAFATSAPAVNPFSNGVTQTTATVGNNFRDAPESTTEKKIKENFVQHKKQIETEFNLNKNKGFQQQHNLQTTKPTEHPTRRPDVFTNRPTEYTRKPTEFTRRPTEFTRRPNNEGHRRPEGGNNKRPNNRPSQKQKPKWFHKKKNNRNHNPFLRGPYRRKKESRQGQDKIEGSFTEPVPVSGFTPITETTVPIGSEYYPSSTASPLPSEEPNTHHGSFFDDSLLPVTDIPETEEVSTDFGGPIQLSDQRPFKYQTPRFRSPILPILGEFSSGSEIVEERSRLTGSGNGEGEIVEEKPERYLEKKEEQSEYERTKQKATKSPFYYKPIDPTEQSPGTTLSQHPSSVGIYLEDDGELTAPSAPSPTFDSDESSPLATPTLMYTPITAFGAEVESATHPKYFNTGVIATEEGSVPTGFDRLSEVAIPPPRATGLPQSVVQFVPLVQKPSPPKKVVHKHKHGKQQQQQRQQRRPWRPQGKFRPQSRVGNKQRAPRISAFRKVARFFSDRTGKQIKLSQPTQPAPGAPAKKAASLSQTVAVLLPYMAGSVMPSLT